MKLFILYGTASGYDTFDSCIVCAENEEEAKNINPMYGEKWVYWCECEWAKSPEDVTVEYIGEADENIEKGVVLASYNAG